MAICSFQGSINANVTGEQVTVEGELVEIDGQPWTSEPPSPPPPPPPPSGESYGGPFLFVAPNGVDDTANIQAALDTGRPVQLHGGDFIVSQIQLAYGAQIFGIGSGSAPNRGTRLHQKAGSNQSVIVPKPGIPTNEWLHWAQIKDLQLRGDSAASAGCGIDITRRTGENFLISNVLAVGFPESGIRLTRGSTPGGIFNCACFNNGQYGFDLQRTNIDIWHQFAVRSVSGDNNGQALIRIKTYGAAEDMIFIDGVKSETSVAGKQQDVIVLDALNSAPIKIENVTAHAAVPMRSVVRITSTNARVICGYFRSAPNCANWIYDEAGGTPKTLARESGTTACLVDGVWASNLPDPSINIRTKMDF